MNYRAKYEGHVARVTPFHATAMQDTPGLSGLGVSSEWLWRARVDNEIVTDAEGHSLFVDLDEAKRVAERHLAAGSPVRWEEIP